MKNWIGIALAGVALGALAVAFARRPSAAFDPGETLDRADPDMRRVLEKLVALGAKPLGAASVAATRRAPTPADAVAALLAERGTSPADIAADAGVGQREVTYGDDPAQVIRLYTPAGERPAAGWPVVVYFHGGGWVIADLDTYSASAVALTAGTSAVVASVEYRHAPEHTFPAAHEDAARAYRWILDNGDRLGLDTGRIALAGESAGGNLAVNVAIGARDAGWPAPRHMLLVYPVAGVDMTTPSYQENENAIPLGRGGMDWFVSQIVKGPADLESAMLDLVGRAELQGLPPATVITAEIDPLRSEGLALADKLALAGVPVRRRDYAGVTHEFFGMAPVVAKARDAQDFAVEGLREALAAATTPT